jgi:hypothetical protein
VNLEDLANVGEFVSGVAVVASLVYLALQVRQNTASIRTENFARGLERVSAMQSMLSRDARLATLHARGVLDVGLLTPQERIQFTWWLAEACGTFEFMFHQARSGAMPDEVWERWRAIIAWWFSYAGVQAWWRANPTPFSASFSAFVEECIARGPADPGAAERWQAFVRGEGRPGPEGGGGRAGP